MYVSFILDPQCKECILNWQHIFDWNIFGLVNIHIQEKNFEKCTKCAVFSLTPESSPDLLLHEARDEIPTPDTYLAWLRLDQVWTLGPRYIRQEKFLAEPGYLHVAVLMEHIHTEQTVCGKIVYFYFHFYLSLYNRAQLDFSLNGFCFWLANPFIRKSSFPWSVQYFCRSLQACNREVMTSIESSYLNFKKGTKELMSPLEYPSNIKVLLKVLLKVPLKVLLKLPLEDPLKYSSKSPSKSDLDTPLKSHVLHICHPECNPVCCPEQHLECQDQWNMEQC